jgi:aspartate carbamoyltransferase catalytic subunit
MSSDLMDPLRVSTFTLKDRHFLDIPQMNRVEVDALLTLADQYATFNQGTVKKLERLRGRSVMMAFFENSTRTLASFDMAAKRLGADVIVLPMAASSTAKGESFVDTIKTLDAMRPDLMVIRHSAAGAPALAAQISDASIINAGDGAHAHPTQALLDALTLQRAFGTVAGLKIAICGDIMHSRVARSNIALLTMLGADVRLAAPPTLMPRGFEAMGIPTFTKLDHAIEDADVVMMLRVQRERMTGAFTPSTREYFRFFGLTGDKLKALAPRARVMHPGPMNRGVEISAALADHPTLSLITDQVEHGVAVRMAVLDAVMSNREAAGL